MSLMDAAAPLDALTDAERLAELERTIERNLDGYLRVGRALETIRRDRLYLLSHRSFREYVAERWGLSQPRGFALLLRAGR